MSLYAYVIDVSEYPGEGYPILAVVLPHHTEDIEAWATGMRKALIDTGRWSEAQATIDRVKEYAKPTSYDIWGNPNWFWETVVACTPGSFCLSPNAQGPSTAPETIQEKAT